MSKDDQIIESLIKGGLVGAGLGALLSKNKEDGAILGALAGAALLATYNANQKAKETNLPMLIEEDGSLFEVDRKGNKKFIKNIEKSAIKLVEHFKLT